MARNQTHGRLFHLEETLRFINNSSEMVSYSILKEVLVNVSCTQIMDWFQSYLNYLRNENGSLSTFWLSYVDMVEIILGLLRASRKGNI